MEQTLPDVSKMIIDYYGSTAKNWPQYRNRASNLGHPCERYLTYCRLDWKEKPLPSANLMMIFNGGNVIEKHIAKVYLEHAGFNIIQMSWPYEWKEKEIGAYLDFICKKDDLEFPVEAKSMTDHMWRKINTIQDFLDQKKHYYKSYPAQLTVYMLNGNRPFGMFLLINKTTYEPKHIWYKLDYEYAEQLVQKAERINAHVKNNTYPERMDFDPDICTDCEFSHVCLPDVINKQCQIISDIELENKIREWAELKEFVSKYEYLDKELTEQLKGRDKILLGNYIITGKFITRKAYASNVKESTYWSKKIGILDSKLIKPQEKP